MEVFDLVTVNLRPRKRDKTKKGAAKIADLVACAASGLFLCVVGLVLLLIGLVVQALPIAIVVGVVCLIIKCCFFGGLPW